ncbi:MAG: homoserine dehydrogenase [Pelagibacteraceae bacterium TMED287]|nr:MAG: homoserine dehydrogenase [Pelagibacteraceae bacterium TMED287]
MNKKKQLNIAIVGLGNIGSYLYQYLLKNRERLRKKTNVLLNVSHVCAKNIKKKRLFVISKNKWLRNPLEVSTKNNIDIVVELIGGSDGIAKRIVFSALKNKKHVVTANKALIAKHGDQLAKIAEKNNVNLEFEAAVCGGLPIVRSIKEGLIANNVSKVKGIFNGTSNYILSSMDKDNITFKESLNKAKRLGYAESNPKSDINGEDVASKLKILTSLAFNTYINNDIHVEGISQVDQEDIINANNLGYKIKLLGISESENNKITQRVHPSLIKNNHFLSSIDGVQNVVIVNGNPVGQSVLQGEGAGPRATTSALVSDISSIARGNIKYPFSISDIERKKLKPNSIKEKSFSAYIRLDVIDKHGVLSNITSFFSRNKVSIKRLIQNPFKSKKNSSIVIITHSSKETNLNKTISQLSKKKYIIKKPKLIRIED